MNKFFIVSMVVLALLGGIALHGEAASLHNAIKEQDLAQVRLLLKAADTNMVNAQDSNTTTPLVLAAIQGNLDIVKELITAGANVNLATEGGLTPLHCAVNKDFHEVAKYLIKKGANVNAVTAKGSTSLHWASYNKNYALCKLLIQAGAIVNAKAMNGFTPLHWAAYTDAGDLVTLLIANGADLTLTDNNNQTARAVAEERNAKSALEAMKPRKSSVMAGLFSSSKKFEEKSEQPAKEIPPPPAPAKIQQPVSQAAAEPEGKITKDFSNGAHYTGQPISTTKRYEGEISFPDGSRYNGQLLANKRDGQGKLTLPNGAQYDGCLLYTSPSPRD